MTKNNISINSLEKNYAKVNLNFIIVAFVSAILVICGDGYVYYKNNYTFLFAINTVLLGIIMADILLVFTKKIKVSTGFIIYLYTILLNITLTHLNEYKYDNFISNTILIGFWGLLLIVVGGIALGKWHPYLVVVWTGSLLFYDIIRTNSSYLMDTTPIIIITLAGIAYGVSSYMNILRESFQKNQDAYVEITNQKNHIEIQAKELEINNINLTRLQNIQRDLIEMLVHDMKNPLNNILINTSSKTSSFYEKKTIYEAGRQMLLLVENMLDVHRMEKVNPIFNYESIHIESIINEAVKLIEFLLNQRGMTMQIKGDNSLHVKADKEILIRIFVNLFTNAIKHSTDNSTLTVSSNRESDDFIAIHVTDQGEGIPELYKEKIFEKYVQGVSLKSGSARSTGLGLTFCKMSIELMSGKIWVADSSSKGTTISFTLPAEMAVNPAKIQHKPHKKFNILPEDIMVLKPIALEVKNLELYKAGLIFNALNKISPNNKRVDKWVEEIKNAVFSSNHKKFRELLELINE